MLEMFASQAALAISSGLIFQNVLDRAQRDSLTRLFNHGHFQEALRNELERASRYGTPLSVIMVDIDHFKRFNDTWGHQTGDKVLKQAALLLSALVRVTDLPARYGGEEFSLLLPHTDYKAALDLAERLRSGIERKVMVTSPKGDKIGVTASLGVATFPRHGADAASLVALADEAMYLAKDRGRNRVAGADEVGAKSQLRKAPEQSHGRRRTRKVRKTQVIDVISTPVSPPKRKRSKAS
jgi:diguanylate cyclase (GGDEF)-like protein